jgi:hypothetical protein
MLKYTYMEGLIKEGLINGEVSQSPGQKQLAGQTRTVAGSPDVFWMKKAQ